MVYYVLPVDRQQVTPFQESSGLSPVLLPPVSGHWGGGGGECVVVPSRKTRKALECPSLPADLLTRQVFVE